jgi:molecular chaperone DnaK (HSP70)
MPPRPRGKCAVDVKFALDANGILQVTAEVKDSDISKSITIDQNKVCYLIISIAN